MNLTRRALLTGGTATTTVFAGCQLPILSGSEKIDLELINYAPDPQQISVSLLRPDKREFSEAEVFSRNFHVPPPEGDETAGVLREQNVTSRRQYLVRATPKFGVRRLYQYRYFPGENTTNPEESYIPLRIYPNCYFRDCENTDDVYVSFY